MPSVRVRRSAYSSVSDGSQDRSLAAIFAAGHQTSSPTDDLPPLPAPPFLQGSLRGSKIQTHIASRARANSVARASLASSGGPPLSPGSGSNERAPSPLSHHSGAQTDVVTRARPDGEPGLIESNLSLPHTGQANELDHHDDIVEHLDVIDPQVGTVSTLTNAANALLFPPTWYSRKPVVTLSSPSTTDVTDGEKGKKDYEDSLDRHIEDVLAKPSKYRRTLMGVWAFLKTPLGILTGIYGFAVVFWGAAIVFFLAKFINFHNANTQGFWVEVSSQVVNGLFTVTGVGLIPSRVLDTYREFRISWIYYYKRRTRTLRRKAGLPELFDSDDLPDPIYDPNYVHVLTDEEQKFLHRQQVKFQRHQTWYRAHGTETHRAFPISTALIICCLNDGNSIFQVMLCGTMWGLDRFQRPAWSTGILIPASFLCGIGAAIMIAIGGNHTKRVEKVKERLRAALAMEHPAYGAAESDAALLQNGGGDTTDTEKKATTSNGHAGGSSGVVQLQQPQQKRTVSETVEAETALDERMVVPQANEKGIVA
ncbi:hypothetical protein R3P38DRAFT_2831728 [Favolaschia claudopus]|uniref:Uncharacterized protein n=1 Tax=Favolaschia claudopus TaxID=2862362 RepID=A0AAW0EC34_9AGAR